MGIRAAIASSLRYLMMCRAIDAWLRANPARRGGGGQVFFRAVLTVRHHHSKNKPQRQRLWTLPHVSCPLCPLFRKCCPLCHRGQKLRTKTDGYMCFRFCPLCPHFFMSIPEMLAAKTFHGSFPEKNVYGSKGPEEVLVFGGHRGVRCGVPVV